MTDPTTRLLTLYRTPATVDPSLTRAIAEAEKLVIKGLLARSWDDGRPRYVATEAGVAVLREQGA